MFNEITERAVKAAFLHPGKIDTNKVNAQQARRVLDRLVGYKLSPLLWEKIRRGLSAGRVQSVAVRLLTEREREIAAFVPVEYWSLHAKLKGKNPPDFIASLKEVRGEKAALPDEAATLAVMAALHGAAWTVKSVTRGERRRNPAPPFITSTLQQDASRKLHFTAKKTMMLAQQLYEGVELGEEGAVGLITYMRTDAVRVAAEAQEEAREWVTGRLGREYLPDAPPTYKAKKSAQEAHEAVRPSSVAREPKAVARFLSKDQLALYRIIWERFLASQMLPAVYDTVAADIVAGDCLFRAQGSTLKFPGFTAVYVESREVTDEAPEEEAEAVVPALTAGVEESLDKIEEGEADWVKTVGDFYKQFSRDLKAAGKKMDNVKVGIDAGQECPECGKPLLEKWGRFGKFLACSAYPECKFTKDMSGGRERPADQPTDEICPTCSRPMVIKHGRFGKFIACSGYPECKTTKPVTLGITCPQPGCGGQLTEKRTRKGKTFYACTNYPTCTFAVWTRPVAEPCPKCAATFVTERIARGGKITRQCVREECGYRQEVAP